MVGAVRVTAVIASLVLLWVLPSALAGLQHALASRAMLGLPRDLAQTAAAESWTVFTGPALHGVEIAIVVALVVLVARVLLARRAQRAR
ncbi:hypothetical protein BRM3_11600 [Brachybacterium huguangmaarense]|uniref:Uncharacterized protein n=1 Tax=Brachybacterium huguangmaarense TaxID=1652028 RepID=A0ABY6G0Q5_9MICO|nr:hypothetical protein [Brachybacterium huguangmaarense]UYG16249.1 hypothetical protein BRM3_11600 [Brachybacterium huguangmaarense]